MLTSAHHVTSITGDPRYRNMMGNLYSERSRSASPATIATRTQSHTASAGRRRTVALEMAYRPGGVLAAKLHLKHVAAATTEGYAARLGGAQAELLAEVNKLEADHKLQLVLAEFRNYQQGILPAGPAARSLTDFFATVDADLNTESTAAPRIQRNDRDILNLLSKRARRCTSAPRTTAGSPTPPARSA
jgi:hypothetical protein